MYLLVSTIIITHGPVDQVLIEVSKAKIAKWSFKSWNDILFLVKSVPQFRSNKNILSFDSRVKGLLEADPDLVFVAVNAGAVDMTETGFYGDGNRSLYLAGLGQPGAEAQLWLLIPVVQLY